MGRRSIGRSRHRANLGLAPLDHRLLPGDVAQTAHQAQAGEQFRHCLVTPRAVGSCLYRVEAVESLHLILPELLVLPNGRAQTLPSLRSRLLVTASARHTGLFYSYSVPFRTALPISA